MTNGSNLPPPDFESLNRLFYQEIGPAEFICMRLYSLCVIGGAQEAFKNILSNGVEFAGVSITLRSVEESDVSLEQSDDAFCEHFLRIEAHHLKHLAIETLLRMFLGHKGYPACPWYVISKETNFAQFKKAVSNKIVEAELDVLQSDVASVILGRSNAVADATDEDRDTSLNLACFLKSFATDWLAESKSYNATKHGLTAIPGAASLRIGPDMIELGYGDSLSHLSYGEWNGDERVWSLKTRWIRMREAVGTIGIVTKMLASLWSVARARYCGSDNPRIFRLPSSAFSLDDLRDLESCSAREMSVPKFRETRRSRSDSVPQVSLPGSG